MTRFLEPFAPLFELSRDLERRLGGLAAAPSFLPPADVAVTEGEVLVTMDVPGLRPDDLDIELQDDVLTVRGERRPPEVPGDGSAGPVWQHLERGHGRFERSLRVPQGLDPDRISAAVADGVLTLRIPRPEERRPRRIAIAAGDASADRRELSAAGG